MEQTSKGDHQITPGGMLDRLSTTVHSKARLAEVLFDRVRKAMCVETMYAPAGPVCILAYCVLASATA